MIGIKIGHEYLDLAKNTRIEMLRESPILQFNEEVRGGYTIPFEIRNSDKNARILGFSGTFQKRLNSIGQDCEILDNGRPLSKGKLKLERTAHHLNRTSATALSAYIVTETGDFYQDAKDKKLRDIDVGGDRSFPWDGLTISGPGFWSHIHQVANAAVNAFDYAFYPVINEGWESRGTYPSIMNMVYYDAAQVHFPTNYVEVDLKEINRIVPMPYLHYVLKKAFEFCGWKVTGSIFDDVVFTSATMLNFRAIDWAIAHDSGPSSYTPRNPVVFNLQDHLPDITIPAFLIALKNLLGWSYDWNKSSKTCTINLVKDIPATTPKDYTSITNPRPLKNIMKDQKSYALRIGEEPPDFSLVDLQGNVNTYQDLPAAAEALYGHVYLVVKENCYFICQQNESDAWVWEVFAHNNFDYVPDGANEDISTDVRLPNMEFREVANDSWMLLPRMDQQGEWFGRTDGSAEWGIHLALYHGVRFDLDLVQAYPYASTHIYDARMNQVAAWGLTYRCFKSNGDDVGLYNTFWKPFLDMLKVDEEIEIECYLNRVEYMKLLFTDLIVVDGVKLIIKTIKPSFPYKDRVSLVCWRI
jgi:hypothetical protein